MENFPEDLLYTKEHEWCRVEGDVATIGITWYAQDQLGDIVYCELPPIGEKLTPGASFGVVESVKTVSDLYAPLGGEVIERNMDVVESPEGLNDEPYDEGWLIKVKLSDPSEIDALMNVEAYAAFLEESED